MNKLLTAVIGIIGAMVVFDGIAGLLSIPTPFNMDAFNAILTAEWFKTLVAVAMGGGVAHGIHVSNRPGPDGGGAVKV